MSVQDVLAAIYGHDKTASEAQAEELDLTQISGADLLAGLESGEIVLDDGEGEKTAADEEEIDFSQFSAAELLEALAEIEDESEKTAGDEDFAFFDAAGRIMAHAYADEMDKMASVELPDELEINLDEISAEDFMALEEAGYEFSPIEEEKTAGAADRLRYLKETYRKSVGASKAQAKGGHPSARGFFGRHKKAVETTFGKTTKGERAAAAAAAGIPAAAGAGYMLAKKKKD
jgi:hypothetical protein